MASYHVKYICFPTKKRTEFCVITATLTDIFNDDFCAYRNTLCYLKNRLIFTFPRQYKESLVAGEEHFCNVCNLFESCLGYSDTLWQFYNILQIVLKVLFFYILSLSARICFDVFRNTFFHSKDHSISSNLWFPFHPY